MYAAHLGFVEALGLVSNGEWAADVVVVVDSDVNDGDDDVVVVVVDDDDDGDDDNDIDKVDYVLKNSPKLPIN